MIFHNHKGVEGHVRMDISVESLHEKQDVTVARKNDFTVVRSIVHVIEVGFLEGCVVVFFHDLRIGSFPKTQVLGSLFKVVCIRPQLKHKKSHLLNPLSMNSLFPVRISRKEGDLLIKSPEAASQQLHLILHRHEFDLKLAFDSGLTMQAFGTPKACVLTRTENGRIAIYSLSKRKQTSHMLLACGRSEIHWHHQVLQKDDIVLILSQILHSQPVSDAYHLEKVAGKSAPGIV